MGDCAEHLRHQTLRVSSALAEAILGIEFCGGLIASMSISAELMAHHDITEGETEGFIGYARSIEV